MSHKSSPVAINAVGISGSGRTLILTLIQKALIDAGFTSVIYENPEMKTETRFAFLDEVLEERNTEFFSKAINLSEVQVLRKATPRLTEINSFASTLDSNGSFYTMGQLREIMKQMEHHPDETYLNVQVCGNELNGGAWNMSAQLRDVSNGPGVVMTITHPQLKVLPAL